MYEHCDNVAAILFGSVECSENDKLYVQALTNKYEELKLQIVRYALHKNHGDPWYR